MSGSPGQIQLFAAVPGGVVGWRLLSGNNREIGRSASSFADALDCERAVRRAQADVPNLATSLRRVDLHRWAWEVRLDGVPTAVGGHSFDRQVRCKQAMAQFLDQFADAQIRPTIVVSGARRWQRAAS